MKLQGASTPRPMTHDLLFEMLGELDVCCTRVAVTELRENTFYASITLSVNGREVEIDSRPSDALALAVRAGAPIFAAEDVIAESAIEFEHEVEDTEEVVDKFKEFLDQVSPEDFGGEGEQTRRVDARAVERRRSARAERRGRASARRSASNDDARPPRRPAAAARSPSGPGSRWPRARQLAGGVVEHQVDAREAVAAEHAVGVERELLGARGRLGVERPPGRRTRCGRSRSGPRSRRSRRRAGPPRRPAAPRARRARRRPRRRGRGRRRGARAAPSCRRRTRRRARPARRRRCGANLMPERGALRGRLDDDREVQPLLDRRQRLGGAERLERGLAEGVEVGRRDARRRAGRAWRAPCPSSACRPTGPDAV